MKVIIEHSSIFPAYGSIDPSSYYDIVRDEGPVAGRERYRNERAAEACLIAAELAPDYLALLVEPDTQNGNFGLIFGQVLFNQSQWRAYLEYVVQSIESALPGHSILLGAGSGTWESRDYVELFAEMEALDYIDFHVYPVSNGFQNYLQNVIDWVDYVRSVDPDKKITIGEAWLYKASAAEVAEGMNNEEIFSRDVYSFWEPLDIQFLRIFHKVCHYQRIEYIAPFWTNYFFAYLNALDPALEGLEPLELLRRINQEAAVNIAGNSRTGTGEAYKNIVSELPE